MYCAHSLCSHTALPLSTHLLCFAHSFVLLIPLLAPLRNSGLSWLPAHAHRLLLSLTHRELKIAVNLHTPPPSYTHTPPLPLTHTHTLPLTHPFSHTPPATLAFNPDCNCQPAPLLLCIDEQSLQRRYCAHKLIARI